MSEVKPRLTDSDLKLKLTELWNAGVRGRWKVCEELRKTYSVDSRRVSATYDELEKELQEYTKELQEDRLSLLTDEAKATYRDAIVTDLEIEVIMSSIVTGRLEVEEFVRGEAILRGVTPHEMINAAKLLWQKRGSLAPTKVAATDKEGNDVAQIKMDDNQFNKIVQLLNAPGTG